MESGTGCIYIATINDDKSYIGYTVDYVRRMKQHRRAASEAKFHRAIRKHGWHAVKWRVLEGDIPIERLPDREVLWIAFYDTYHNGYNMTEGGDGSPMSSPEVRAKISASHRAKSAVGEHWMQRPEVRAKISYTRRAQAARGEHSSQRPEVRAKMSATRRAMGARGEHSSQRPEVRAKISAYSRARVERGNHLFQCPKWRARKSELIRAKASRGEHSSQRPEVKAKVSATQKAKAARGEHHLQRPEVHAQAQRTKRKNRGIIDWVDALMEEESDD